MKRKCIVRISPLLLGRVGEAAMKVEVGSLICQFAGKCMVYNDAKEWNVTHAILSNSLAVSSAETRLKRNEQVDAVMHHHELVHIGWLRQASKACPLSSLDLDTQRVYEKHLPDAFAALLDLSPTIQEPVVYFYCLVQSNHSSSSDAFVAAQHVVLDSSVPFNIIEVSLPSMGKVSPQSLPLVSQQSSENQSSGLPSRRSDETENTAVELQGLAGAPEAPPSQALSADDLMSMSIL